MGSTEKAKFYAEMMERGRISPEAMREIEGKIASPQSGLFVIECDVPMSRELVGRIREEWFAATKGTDLEGSKLLILDSGLKLRPVSHDAVERFRLAAVALRERGITDAAEWCEKAIGGDL